MNTGINSQVGGIDRCVEDLMKMANKGEARAREKKEDKEKKRGTRTRKSKKQSHSQKGN